MKKIKEVIYNDLELYFYLYRDLDKWALPVMKSYVKRSGTTPGFFVEALVKFCTDHHYIIKDRKYDDQTMMFYIEKEDQPTLKPKNGIYDTPMTTRRQ